MYFSALFCSVITKSDYKLG